MVISYLATISYDVLWWWLKIISSSRYTKMFMIILPVLWQGTELQPHTNTYIMCSMEEMLNLQTNESLLGSHNIYNFTMSQWALLHPQVVWQKKLNYYIVHSLFFMHTTYDVTYLYYYVFIFVVAYHFEVTNISKADIQYLFLSFNYNDSTSDVGSNSCEWHIKLYHYWLREEHVTHLQFYFCFISTSWCDGSVHVNMS